jgi:MFS family permease
MGSYIEDEATLTWNDSKQGWLVSILELGAWFGTMYSGFLAEILSRKYAILVNVTIFVIGVVLQTTAITPSGHSSILGGRFITGTSNSRLQHRNLQAYHDHRYGCWLFVHDCTNV